MKELEVKSMLCNPSIPDSYKLGGRLDDRFLDGVEYAERMMGKNTIKEVWAFMDDGDDKHIYITDKKPEWIDGIWEGKILMTFSSKVLPSLTPENSPRRIRLILEDE